MKQELKTLIRKPAFIFSAILVGGSSLTQGYLSYEKAQRERIHMEYMRLLSLETVASREMVNTIHNLTKFYGYGTVFKALNMGSRSSSIEVKSESNMAAKQKYEDAVKGINTSLEKYRKKERKGQ